MRSPPGSMAYQAAADALMAITAKPRRAIGSQHRQVHVVGGVKQLANIARDRNHHRLALFGTEGSM
jgi:hypothetical protein